MPDIAMQTTIAASNWGGIVPIIILALAAIILPTIAFGFWIDEDKAERPHKLRAADQTKE